MIKKKRPTLDKILADLETAKQMAIEDRHITGIITASMAQAKLLGYDKGNNLEVNHNIKPTTIQLIAKPFPNDPVQASQYYKELMQ